MLLEILPAKLVITYFQSFIVKVLLSISLAVVKVNLYRLLDDINVLEILILEARDFCAVFRLT